MTGGGHSDQHVGRNSDQCDTTTRNPGSWLPSSELTPLDEVEEIQTSTSIVIKERIPSSGQGN